MLECPECAISDAKCVGFSLEQPGRDLSRTGPNRPLLASSDIAGGRPPYHLANNLNPALRPGRNLRPAARHPQARFTATRSRISTARPVSGDNVGAVRLAVAIDTIIPRQPRSAVSEAPAYGIVLGPLYQGARITGNVIMDTAGSPLHFIRSHGPALVDNNVIIGPGAATGEGVKLRGAEANVFALNLFDGCAFTSESLPGPEAGGTISYRPHTLVTKQTIPASRSTTNGMPTFSSTAGSTSCRKTTARRTTTVYMAGAAGEPVG